jgi:two-component system response regulator YesN
MFLNYRPIGKLIRMVEQKWGTRSSNAYGIEKVHSAIEQADSRARQLQSQVELSQPVVKEHLLLQLLQGRYGNQDEFNSIGAPYGLVLTKRSFFTTIIQLDQADGEQLQAAMNATSDWGGLNLPHAELYVVKMEADKRLTLLVSAEPDELLSESVWKGLQDTVTEVTGLSVTIGIGEMYDNIGEIGKSYIEASSAIAYKLIKGNHTIISFKETFAGSKTFHWYPKREMAQLEIYIRQRNGQKFRETVEALIRKIEENSTTLFMAKFVCFDIINTVMKGIDDLQGLPEPSLDIFPDVLKLTQYNDIRELVDIVADVSQNACELLESDNKDGEELLLALVLSYLQERFVSYHFSVQQMADDLQVSTSYLGRYVKEHTGRTILEHVNELRIEKAKQLLIETELQLIELVPLVGYADVSSFIRKFKQAVSVTPGEYRKMYGRAQ